ncbi:cytochrome P450 [Gonapodya prolifera JEL478]|uniref:Cytochrome P450 n=1 Tax=Gonapodya prolifera (strain JEL478) TaxID=1344416 RepID=A0A139AFP3_GONPJ|nr:cytochrome P450 [Gonapodya prolifera JEL478]|eukprot:KXS15642.1 cytochrome P450 [Gonapodya prolifera JEL478]
MKILDHIADLLQHRETHAIAVAVTIVLLLAILLPLRDSPLSRIPTSPIVKWFPRFRVFRMVNGTGHRFVYDLHEQYGTVVRLDKGTISVADVPLAYKLLRIDDIPKSSFYDRLRDRLRDGEPTNLVAERNPAAHKVIRSQVSPAFAIKYLASLEPMMKAVLVELEEKISKAPKEADGYVTLDMVKVYNTVTADFISQTAFGQSLHSVKNGSHVYIDSIKTSLFWGLIGTAIPSFPIHLTQSLQNSEWTIRRLIKSFVVARESLNESGTRIDDILQFLIDQKLPYDKMRVNLAVLMLAGTETTANTLVWATYLLFKHPKKLDRLRRELDDAFPDGLTAPLALAKLKKLPWLNAVIKETLRVRPVVTKVSREVDEDTSVVGHDPDGTPRNYEVPAGSTVEVSIYSLQRSSKLWIRPEDFWPERWLAETVADEEAWGIARDDDTAKDVLEGSANGPTVVCKQAFIPFSLGSRDCIGRNFAWDELRSVLAYLVRRYDLAPAFNTTVDTHGSDFITVRFGSKAGLPVRVRRRSFLSQGKGE